MGPFNFYINLFLYKKDECMFATINDVKNNRHLKSNPDLFRKRFPNDYDEMADRLKDCVSWMITQHPNNIPNRIDSAQTSVERAVALACKEDKSEDTNV